MEKDLDPETRQEFIAVYNECKGVQLPSSIPESYKRDELMSRWDIDKQRLFCRWANSNDCPGRMGTRSISLPRHGPFSRGQYVKAVEDLDFSQEESIAIFRRDFSSGDYGPAFPSLWLFKRGGPSFYLSPHPAFYDYIPEWYIKEDPDWDPTGAPEGTMIKVGSLDQIYKFVPPITPPAQSPESVDVVDGHSLHYGLMLGSLWCSRYDDICDYREFLEEEQDFLVFLHPADKSLWLVFNCFPMRRITGEPYFIPDPNRELQWYAREGRWPQTWMVARLPFSYLKRGLTSFREEDPDWRWLDGSSGHDGEQSDSEVVVVVNGDDPVWNGPMKEPNHRPIPENPPMDEFMEYLTRVRPSQSQSLSKHAAPTSSAATSEQGD
ncbi:hypothetical protein A1O3_07826 [Capronia epimyces CBS 606.96]|uniref:Uncharacterized protein n=1 Tax=Capronia epimyces CBS 606.96 TaxID=1182542 RepID=W9XGB2_9EURO|nr:uncharacterized protein A1O3_07826 [Capronia epimyces CBS 606.96]EXJ79547.1 hypothetical protein A1O3_07826 [Capronia epimyces CBS 606.96]